VRHLTVVSYNIHRGVGLDRRRDLDRIADVIGEVGPDVVGLQEVIREDGVPVADQAAYLAARLEMSELVMGETRAYGTGIYGNVVLSRLPILGSGRCDLSFGMRQYENQEEYAAAVQQMDMLARVLERGGAGQARDELP